MISVVIPAHNEAAVISRCLEALVEHTEPGELDVVVVCNGCEDDTAEIARMFGPPVKVVEIPVASKIAALNAGYAEVEGFPRFYLDADTRLGTVDLRLVAEALRGGKLMAAAPRAAVNLDGASVAVRAFYRVWQLTPYLEEGMIGCGVYALTRTARERFGRFPQLIADDGYVRALFRPGERATVDGSTVTVWAPRTIQDLVRAKARSRLGAYQLRSTYPELVKVDQRNKSYLRAIGRVIRKPSLWLSVPVYLWVNLLARLMARQRLQRIDEYRWDRDASTRN